MVTLKDAKEVSEVIRREFAPVSIVVFGSTARLGSGNDLDLLVVLDDAENKYDNVNLSMHRCLKDFCKRFAIDPFVVFLSAFREHYLKGSPFLQLIFKEGRFLYMRDAERVWIQQAEEDLKMAEVLMANEYYRGACFHSQQAAEKTLKALLLSKGWELERTHRVDRLISVAEDYGIKIEISDDDVSFIDSIYRGRYPAEAGLMPLGEPTKADAERTAGIARHILKAVKAKLG